MGLRNTIVQLLVRKFAPKILGRLAPVLFGKRAPQLMGKSLYRHYGNGYPKYSYKTKSRGLLSRLKQLLKKLK
jgi:hypothetical protein